MLVYLVWTLPFALWMLQSYVAGIPKDLEEAALVDGAGRLTILRTVIAPLLAPGIVVTALFAFITAWNEFFLALVLLQTPSLTTLPLLLAQFVGIEGIVRLGPLAASALLATIPSLLIFALIQRWLTRGILAGRGQGLSASSPKPPDPIRKRNTDEEAPTGSRRGRAVCAPSGPPRRRPAKSTQSVVNLTLADVRLAADRRSRR